nr:hypothetical protein [Tanacetum cinerariifolium]
MVEQAKLKLDLVGKPVDHTDYRSMIGSLMYVTSSRPDIMFAASESEYVADSSYCAQVLRMRTQLTDYGFFYDKVPIYSDSKGAIAISCNPVQHTRTKHIDVRLDIMFATCMYARYHANPNEHHVSTAKRIFRYLKGTINLGIWYPKDFGFDLTAYSDADHAGCHLDQKKSEYVAVSSCCAQVLWMRTQLTDYGFFYDKVPIYCDSKSAIVLSFNPVQHTRTKHIDV